MDPQLYFDIVRTKVPLAQRTVIDIGCGAGQTTNLLADLGAGAIGVEWRPELLRLCGQSSEAKIVRYVKAMPQSLPFADQTIDVVCYFDTLWLFEKMAMQETLREAHRILRPGGQIIVVEMMNEGPFFEIVACLDETATAQRELAHQTIIAAHELQLIPVSDHIQIANAEFSDFAAFKNFLHHSGTAKTEKITEHEEILSAEFDRLGFPHENTHLLRSAIRLNFLQRL